jgi:hypothetical protein
MRQRVSLGPRIGICKPAPEASAMGDDAHRLDHDLRRVRKDGRREAVAGDLCAYASPGCVCIAVHRRHASNNQALHLTAPLKAGKVHRAL